MPPNTAESNLQLVEFPPTACSYPSFSRHVQCSSMELAGSRSVFTGVVLEMSVLADNKAWGDALAFGYEMWKFVAVPLL